jgi:hypothetical protein
MPPRAQAITSQVAYTNDQIINAATGRWGEIAQEIKPADPYVITKPDGETITITPLTRRRRKALKAAQAAYLMVGAQLAEIQNEQTGDQGVVSRVSKLMDEAEYAYDQALFGDDVVDEIVAYYDDLDEAFWDAMYQDVHDQLVNRAKPPAVEDVTEDGEGKERSS